MKKSFMVVLVAVLVAALSAPAWAVDINGWFAIRGTMSNGRNTSGSFLSNKDADKSNSFVEQRARMKFTFGDENVKFIYQNEIDSLWGGPASSYGSTGGGNLGTDGINLETKNAYLWFKAPANFQVLAGLINLSDPYAGLIYGGADFAALAAITDVGPVNLTVAAAKFSEGNTDKADDSDLYLVRGVFAPAKDMSVGATFHYLKDRGGLYGDQSPSAVLNAVASKLDLYIVGADFTGAFGPAKVNAFAFYQSGKIKNVDSSVDLSVKAYAADVRADVTAGPGTGFIELLYASGDKDASDKDVKGIITADTLKSGQAAFNRTGLAILHRNANDLNGGNMLFGKYLGGVNNLAGNGAASNAAAGNDDGLLLVAAGYGMKFTESLKGNFVLGWAQAAVKDEDLASYQKKDYGTELGASVTYAVQKGLDATLAFNYCMVGDYFKPGATTDRADINMTTAFLKYTF